MVTVAINSMGRSFHGSTLSTLSWVLNAYAIIMAAFLVVAGQLGDRQGNKNVFIFGTALFTLASAACTAAPNLAVLIVARAFQGAGAAAQLPTSLALLIAVVREEQRGQAVRLWSAFGAMAAAFGPVAGGLLVQYSWRWVFAINIPIGIAILITGRLVLPRNVTRSEPLPDLAGSGLLIVSICTLTGALVQAPDWGWGSDRILLLLAAAVLTGAAFVRRCVTHPAPLVEISTFRDRTFGIANLGNLLFSIGFSILLLSATLWCQQVWHYSALRAGLALAPAPLMVAPAAILSLPLIRRFGSGPVSALGGLLFALATLWLAATSSITPDYAYCMLPALLACGTGFAFGAATLISAAVNAMPAARAATSTAVVNAGRQVAGNLGVAILVTILGTMPALANIHHLFRVAWYIGGAFTLASAFVCLGLPSPRAINRSTTTRTVKTRM
ncbi:MAG: MFS transporter [Trebonia sp.]